MTNPSPVHHREAARPPARSAATHRVPASLAARACRWLRHAAQAPGVASAISTLKTVSALGALVILLPQQAALAQGGTWPAKPVHLVIGFAPGGNPDLLARMIAPRIAELLGGQILIDNKPGSNGNIGADLVAKAAPDGYTLFLSDTSTYSIGPHIYAKLPFDTLRDFTPIVQIAVPPMYVVVNAALPVTSMQELVAWAKANPGKLAYASAGNGSIHHLTTELFRSQTGIDIVHVPYKGSGQSAPALIAGDVQMAFIGWTSVNQGVRAGRLRAIGFASGRRSLMNPDLPTIAETVAPGFDVSSPMGIAGPAGLPREIVERVQNAALEAARAPETRARMLQIGLEMADGTAEVYAATIRTDYDKFGRIARLVGLKLD